MPDVFDIRRTPMFPEMKFQLTKLDMCFLAAGLIEDCQYLVNVFVGECHIGGVFALDRSGPTVTRHVPVFPFNGRE